MASNTPGISTLGVTFGYGIGSGDSKPTTMTRLSRINNIAGITVETEQIDASALEDYITRYTAGRGDTGGDWAITVNNTPETHEEWGALISAYQSKTAEQKMWFEVIIPGFDQAFWVVAQPPTAIPLPEIGQNELLTVDITLTIEDYKGLDTKVAFATE